MKKYETVGTGVPGLDHVLRGGLPDGMVYLVHGGPGSGKTTLGFQFLLEGVRRGERVLFASFLQKRKELERIVASYGWTLDGIDLMDIPDKIRHRSTDVQTMFSPGEIELHEVTQAIMDAIKKHKPQRLVFDSITELGVLVDSPLQLRRQMLKFIDCLEDTGCTSIFTANNTMSVDLPSLQTAVHGVIELGVDRRPYGPSHRWLEVSKLRGVGYRDGRHDLVMRGEGLKVYPQLEVGTESPPPWTLVASGNAELDMLFGGGLESGTSCLITGSTGAGKSTLASLYVQAAAMRGERSIIFCFDERRQTFIQRSQGLGMPIVEHIKQGLVDLRQVDFGHMNLGEFFHELRTAVDEAKAKVVVIDSLTGFCHAMPNQYSIVQLHELLTYLGKAGALTLLVEPTHGIGASESHILDANTSYISDSVVLLRHFEAIGEVRRCISVLKKRHGHHERTIREVTMGPGGVTVGPALTHFRHVLSGMPEFVGKTDTLHREPT